MRHVFLTALLALSPAVAGAQETAILLADTATEAAESEAAPETEPEGLRILEAAEADLDGFLWQARILAVMADSPNDPAFIQQMRYIEAGADRLIDRDVVVITDTAPRGGSALRQRLRPRGFMLAIIEKDGAIAQRRPAPRDMREIAAIIDRFPLRRQEMLERMPSGN